MLDLFRLNISDLSAKINNPFFLPTILSTSPLVDDIYIGLYAKIKVESYNDKLVNTVSFDPGVPRLKSKPNPCTNNYVNLNETIELQKLVQTHSHCHPTYCNKNQNSNLFRFGFPL